MGGYVGVESTGVAGEGACFGFVYPLFIQSKPEEEQLVNSFNIKLTSPA
jgi:hypothetical protein